MKFCNILTMGKNILILNNEVLQIKGYHKHFCFPLYQGQ